MEALAADRVFWKDFFLATESLEPNATPII